ncbi:hypothetical protein LEP1GSC059_4409 [Leptospira noguchii serovar Panama str. CZ214]|uniref:Uncharacterized protein n=1 Tax=Leptospira noguchii serovar Panama str. CZ214 TaxID=1001595 RepID=T0FFU5_9LEPT|nr:hypothetical protein LEP1GSC059_4409 [Leptospira noguchii serovar Panama str. CZ214]
MRKNFLKVWVPTTLEFIRKIVICSSSHIKKSIYKVQILAHGFLTPNSLF